MQHVPDDQPQADLRETAFDQVIPTPAQPDPLEELQRLKQQLGLLAQTLGFDEGADATAVIQEAQRRAGESSGKRSEVLKRPGHLDSPASVTRQSMLPLTQVVRYDGYRFWAVLIGIDAYTQGPLRGCVSDALSVKHFLTDDLGVPENHIQCLLGPSDPNSADPKSKRPTRANIVETLSSLANNPDILRGDNIIIYYAGIGTTYYCTNHDFGSQCDTCPIEALCPIDHGTRDTYGNWIPDISDRELNILFGLICCAKGQNITFIVDANYSGGMSRRQQRGKRHTAPSRHTSAEDMLRTADERWQNLPCYQSVLSKDWRPDMDSHVLLAACQSYQNAEEVEENNEFGGVFSKELVRVLGSTKWRKETTYDDLIRFLNQLPYGQIPLVDGSQTRMPKPIFDRTPPLWAVLIGIDAYTQGPLRGCVSDALLIRRFLTDDLGVPEYRIQCLLGPSDPYSADPKSKRPTRANIVDTLSSLAKNPKILRGDNIIIYYAGHGSRYYCTNHDFESPCDNCSIEALCPIDRDTPDADGNWIPDISDRELNILFGLIYGAKGQNITFIADCCHSGGMSRGSQQGIRSTALTYNASLESMLHVADERWKDLPGYQSVLSKDWRPDMDSHVILAACQSDQTAQEVAGNNGFGGVFSKELVRILRSTDCKEGTTFVDLIPLLNRLPYGQIPLVDGSRTQMLKPIFDRTPPIWAVLIGIDAYTQDPLRGCVSDVSLIKRFLTDDLGVPEYRIQCLLGPSDPYSADPESIRPTRANIVDTLSSLAKNPEIRQGDNIIICYAGHGSRYHCATHEFESGCDNSCFIEALCPIDRDTQDADGKWIPDISDRELNILFGLICGAKGQNITFIVDANYSRRMSRGELPVGMVETPTPVESMLHAADERWKDFPGYRSVSSKDWQPDTDSHVTLAACFSEEMQRENGSWCGKFTNALLHASRSKEEMTYVDLINRMSGLLPPEHPPLVSGEPMNERLWN